MHFKHLSAWAALLAVLACSSVASAADVNTKGLRQAVKAGNVFDNQADLEATLAREHDRAVRERVW